MAYIRHVMFVLSIGSPAKSPILSPLNTNNVTSPQSRATTHSQRLPSIAEDEPMPTLSQRREQAPQSIELPSLSSSAQQHQKEATVSFQQDTPTAVLVQEIAVTPPHEGELSPPPFFNRMAAGHTPLRAPRPRTPPPTHLASMDGMDDTPTRNNTEFNRRNSEDLEDEDKALTGPLNMPELPNRPDETNFTLEALSRRLEQIERSPGENEPFCFAERKQGLPSPGAEDGVEPHLQAGEAEKADT